MALLEERKLPYVLKAAPNRRLRYWADSWTYREIGRTACRDVIKVASAAYRAGEWSRERRMVVVRVRTATGIPGMLFDLPAILEEQFMATTLEGGEEDIWHCYNQRCTSETSIRTLKEDWSFDAFSKDGFGANATDLLLKGMAYNLTLAMQKALNPKDRGPSTPLRRSAACGSCSRPSSPPTPGSSSCACHGKPSTAPMVGQPGPWMPCCPPADRRPQHHPARALLALPCPR